MEILLLILGIIIGAYFFNTTIRSSINTTVKSFITEGKNKKL